MNVPKLTRADLAKCKQCLDHLDRSKGYLQYTQVLGGDVSDPMAQVEAMRNGILGALALSQATEADLAMIEGTQAQ